MRNNLQLQKQYIEVDLMGLNLAIMRGEKIPMMIMDHDKLNSIAPTQSFPGTRAQRMLYESGSGWFVIDSIMWKWDRNEAEHGNTRWTTCCKLVRREWPIPGRNGVVLKEDEEILNETTVDTAGQNPENTTGGEGNTPTADTENPEEQGANESASTPVNVAQDDATQDEVPLTGLKDGLKQIYRVLKQECPGIKLVSARRWAVDEKGNRVDGNAFVQKGGLYKCSNAKGEIMYFATNNSRHLYGEAFDIINGDGQDFKSIMTDYVLLNSNVLQAMISNGVACCIEQTKDDSGVSTKHYHFGTEKEIQKKFWISVSLANQGNLPTGLEQAIKNYNQYNEQARSIETQRNTIQES